MRVTPQVSLRLDAPMCPSLSSTSTKYSDRLIDRKGDTHDGQLGKEVCNHLLRERQKKGYDDVTVKRVRLLYYLQYCTHVSELKWSKIGLKCSVLETQALRYESLARNRLTALMNGV